MNRQLDDMLEEGLAAVEAASDTAELEAARVRFLGRKGRVTEILRGLANVPADERPALGELANRVKSSLSDAIATRQSTLEARRDSRESERAPLDLSLPGRRPFQGHMHPISLAAEEVCGIFQEMGFQIATGPDIESEYYNFDSLNTPEDHPARDSHDTFFVKPGVVLRTHTSPVQMRVMERTQPPVAIIAPGRVYRVDADSTHSPMFYQIEGLLVDEGVSFADLKGTLNHVIRRYFGADVTVRFNPHFFPFTEPSAEVHMLWTGLQGGPARWLEIGGCGMVHPEVFRYAGYDSEKYTGFAFGMGIDRMAMVKYGLDSISYIYDNDVRFLEQF